MPGADRASADGLSAAAERDLRPAGHAVCARRMPAGRGAACSPSSARAAAPARRPARRPGRSPPTLAREDVIVVSGMARGVDSCAHEGALEAGGPHHRRARLRRGRDLSAGKRPAGSRAYWITAARVVSEYPPGTPPHAGNFPARNRIISGMTPGRAAGGGREELRRDDHRQLRHWIRAGTCSPCRAASTPR